MPHESEPKEMSFASRMRITSAAHGIPMYIVLPDMSQLSTQVQLQVLQISSTCLNCIERAALKPRRPS
jgi:hypothetical protein